MAKINLTWFRLMMKTPATVSSLIRRTVAVGADGWRGLGRGLVFVLLVLVVLLVGAQGLGVGLERLAERWAFSYRHGYLLLVMAVWLAGRAMISEGRLTLRPSWPALAALAAGTLGYTLAALLDFTMGMQLVLPFLLGATLFSLGGPELGRKVVLPVLLLYFAVPVWDLAVAPLQLISTVVVTWALTFTGIPAHVEGHLIHLAEGTFEIAEGCSGQRYFMVALALAAFYGFAWLRRWRTRLLLVGLAALLAMFSNWVRIFALILVGEFQGMDHPLIDDHDTFGWVLFALVLIPMLWCARLLEGRDEQLMGSRERKRSGSQGDSVVTFAARPWQFLVAGVVAVFVLTMPRLVESTGVVPEQPSDMALEGMAASPWAVVPGAGDWAPEFHAPHKEGLISFATNGDGAVDVYVVRYEFQHPDSKLIAGRNSVTGGWHQVLATSRRVGTHDTVVAERELIAGGQRRLVWYWYRVGPYRTHDRNQAKLLEALALIRGRRDSGLAAVSAPCDLDCDQARATLARFLESSGPAFDVAASTSASN